MNEQEKEELRRKLNALLADYERIIDETEPMFKELIREDCKGSISSLKSILEEL